MPSYFDLEVQLADIEPMIFRRFLIPTTASFADLHEAIQRAMGWEGHHLWEFRATDDDGTLLAGVADADDPETPDARAIPLTSVFPLSDLPEDGFWVEYTYDFGDYWVHGVGLQEIVEHDEIFARRLLDGERACPPEDCGGPPGYERFVHFLETGDADGDDAEEMREWLGGWTPEAFDLEEVKSSFDKKAKKIKK